MSALIEGVYECPQCHAQDSIDLSGAKRLCLSCRCEWEPGKTVQLPPPAPQLASDPLRPITEAERILHATTVNQVLREWADDAGADELATIHDLPGLPPDDWSDNFVRRIDDNALLLILADDGNDPMLAQHLDGETVDAYKGECVFIGDALPEGVSVKMQDVNDEPLPQTILAVAGLTLTVALEACVTTADGIATVESPRIGWLPPPCDQIPEVEAGVAYAAALLISVFGLDREQVNRLAANLITGAEAGTETESK